MKYPSTILPSTNTEQDIRKMGLDLLDKINKTWDDITANPLSLAGPLTISGDLSVGGDFALTGDAALSGALAVTGAATLSSTLTLSTMTAGSVLFAGTAGLVSQDNANLFWDDANNRLQLPEIRAASSAGLKLFEDGGKGIYVQDSTGYVGIGTTSPSSILDISSSTLTTIRMGFAHNANAQIDAEASFNIVLDADNDDTGRAFSIFNHGNGTTALFTVQEGGNVGIGTTSPSYSLDVTGNCRISTGFGCNGTTPQTAYASGGAAPAGGTGATAGAYDTAAHRDALITLVNNIRAALVANGIMS